MKKTMLDNIDSDEREEGEIVDDDDDLEDVSDSSISSPLHPGKSVSPTEHLRAVSLSSISDEELENNRRIKNGRRKTVHVQQRRYEALEVQLTKGPRNKCERRHRHAKPHRRKRLHSASDSSEEDIPSRRIAKQLKNAVHIQEDKEVCQKSLQSRLKGLLEPANDCKSQSEDEEELEKLRNDALESKTSENQESVKEPGPKEAVEDKELTELRLEALKSAVIQKHMLRKKRKGENDALPKSDSEVNKENTQDNINKETQSQPEKPVKKINHEENVNITNNVSTEEDLDIMRAMLLASMSTKIAKIPDAPTTAILPKPITRTINNPTANSALRKPIIAVRSVKNNYYTNRAVYKVQNKVNNNKVKVPTVEPLIINLNNDSDSDMDIDPPEEAEEDNLSKKVTELLKQERAEVEAKTKQNVEKKVKDKAPLLDKSVLKLLPISQQMEYQKLKQQLLNAKKRPRIRRFSQKVGEVKQNAAVVKRNLKSRFVLNKVNSLNKVSSLNKVNSPINTAVRPRVEKSDTTVRTWNFLQVQMAGRSAGKGKYQELGPLLQKIREVSAERSYYDEELNRLFQEVENIRAKFDTSHQQFKNLVEELLKKKECIDKGTTLGNQTKPVTSTPIRKESKQVKEVMDESPILSKTTIEKVARKIEDILDPNDINGCIVIQKLQDNKCDNAKMPAYISPLDTRPRDSACSDPLATLCPFDLLGVCKDKDCTYKHCS